MNNPNYEVSLTLRVPTFGDIKIEHRHEGQNIHNVHPEKIQQMENCFSVKL